MTINIVRFNESHKEIWNSFISNSKNGTFLFNRNYMEYHKNRFDDFSLLFYKKNELLGVLPANIDKEDNILHSHQGLSYGGLIINKKVRFSDIANMFESLKDFCKSQKIKSIIYKKVPYIYYDYPSSEDDYYLSTTGASLYRRDLGCAIKITEPIKFNNSKKSSLKKAQKSNIVCKQSYDFESYHEIISNSLQQHNATPVHSIKEMKELSKNFPNNIKLFCAYKNDIIISGVLLFIENNVIHTQYMASSDLGKEFGGLEMIINFLIEKFKDEKEFLSFGISTEKGGEILNEGLLWQKESLGGRSICHDFYKINF